MGAYRRRVDECVPEEKSFVLAWSRWLVTYPLRLVRRARWPIMPRGFSAPPRRSAGSNYEQLSRM